jgi:uncharacterized protein (DUF305 family)
VKIRTAIGAVAILTLIGGTALAQHSGSSPLMDAMTKMDKEMPKTHTGNTDVDFAKMMIPHHQGAIDMAKVELQSGKDPMLRQMAEKLIKDQEKEIAELKQWLSKNSK